MKETDILCEIGQISICINWYKQCIIMRMNKFG